MAVCKMTDDRTIADSQNCPEVTCKTCEQPSLFIHTSLEMALATKSPTDSKTLLMKYYNLPQPEDKIQLMYVWVDGSGENIRCKTITVLNEPASPDECPIWNFDGSSTGQADGSNSDIYLKPCAIFRDPFRGGKNKLILCETYNHNMQPHKTNKRFHCQEIMDKAKEHEPWFQIEQEYVMLDKHGRPLLWPNNGFPPAQEPYYFSVGATKALGRDMMEAYYHACLYAGINICGTNDEVMHLQWVFEIGTCQGVAAGDHLWMARFILHRVAKDFGVMITFDPKPVPGDWNGSGAHTKFSTLSMRRPGGIRAIEEAIDKLSKRHQEHLKQYDPKGGADNKRRLSGLHGTSSFDNFTSGVVNRDFSVRIPRQVAEDQRGYLEDRRPAANCDPYSVTALLVETTCLM